MMHELDNTQDILYVSEVEDRITELEESPEIARVHELKKALEKRDLTIKEDDELMELELEHGELIMLRGVKESAELSPDWTDGGSMIHEEFFESYCVQQAEELSSAGLEGWPFNHIDWEAAVTELKTDYFSVEIDGETYWLKR